VPPVRQRLSAHHALLAALTPTCTMDTAIQSVLMVLMPMAILALYATPTARPALAHRHNVYHARHLQLCPISKTASALLPAIQGKLQSTTSAPLAQAHVQLARAPQLNA
jgi:hypothetical protein